LVFVPAAGTPIDLLSQYSLAWRLALSGYAIIKAFSGRGREISWLIYMLAVVLVSYCVFVRRQIGNAKH
jgi:xanthine/uracil/vitamin C permease (AzgA family)